MTLHTEVEYADARYHGINRACTGRLLSLLKAHHDYSVRIPKDHIKPERLIVETPAEPTPEFKELWFGVVSEAPIEPRTPSIDRIQRAVCKHYKAERNDLISPRRTADIVRPRQIAMYLAKKLTLRSLPDIGRRFGGRDHSTVLHAVRKIEARIVTDAKTASEVALLRSLLEPTMEAAE